MEVWKKLDDRYSISSLSRVPSSFNEAIKILKPGRIPNGYETVTFSYGKKRKTHTIHRLMARAFLNVREGQVVNHIDGDKANNMLYNLEVCSQSYNLRLPHFGKKRFVSFNKKSGLFRVHIRHNGKQKFFGGYASKEEAYEIARITYYTLFNTYPWR